MIEFQAASNSMGNKKIVKTLVSRRSSEKKKTKEKESDVNIIYAKEFFINEKGEVIKMAAIVTKDPEIKEKL